MPEDRLPRKLAAILYADVAGYSRLTGEDEDATHRTLCRHLDLISSTVESHGGRVMHYAGDAVLAKFESVVEAMSCAVSIQNELGARNVSLQENRRVRFRIGVNSGDVIEDRGDIYGEGVNVAARLEALAEPGGICVSESIRTAVGSKLGLTFEDMGHQSAKNISRPIHAHRVLLGGVSASSTAEPMSSSRRSIAVLAFENMSGEMGQEYFADGLAEDIITSLSKLSQLLVIARNSSFIYKSRVADVRKIADELGVDFVVQGSVRKVGDRVRITAQLVDCATGGNLWAARFDRDLNDVFAVQDDVTQAIVASLAVEVTADERERLKATGTDELEAYDLFLRGRQQYRLLSKDGSALAEVLLNRAIALDPDYSTAYAYLAFTKLTYYVYRWREPAEQMLSQAHELAQKAVELDDANPYGHLALGKTYMWKRQHEQSITEHQRATALDPNFAVAHAGLGLTLHYAGRSSEGIELITRGMRLDPIHPDVRLLWLAQPYFQLSRYEEAAELLERHLAGRPNVEISRALLAATYGYLGRIEEAKQQWNELLRVTPEYSLAHLEHILPYKSFNDFEKIVGGLRCAGLTQ